MSIIRIIYGIVVVISLIFGMNDFFNIGDKNIESDLIIKEDIVVSMEETDEKDTPIIYDEKTENIPTTPVLEYHTYITNRSKEYMVTCPEFTFEYSDNWKISKEELEVGYEWDVLENERGVTVNYYESSYGFSQYDGGGYTLRYAKITKVADSAFKPGYVSGADYSSLGNFVVVKLEEYAQEDGLNGGGPYDVDGIVVYAVVPESYLGKVSFKGMGFWGTLAWDYSTPIVMMVTSPDGSFTYQEEQEIIQMLSTFRET